MNRRRLAAFVGVTLAAGSLAAQQIPPRDTRGGAMTGTAEISGATTDAATREAVPFVQIGVLGLENGVIRVTSSDASGRFALAGLGAGRYLVSAMKPPYLAMVYGARQPGRAGTAVAVKDGERRSDLVIPLTRGAAISGTITDEFGRPAAGVGLAALPTSGGSLQSQVMSMIFASAQSTDNRGVYRLSGLAPGEYFVVAMRSDRVDPDAHVVTDEEIQAALRALKEPAAAVRTAPPATSDVQAGAQSTTLPQVRPTPAQNQPPPMAMMMGMGLGGDTQAYAPVYFPGTAQIDEAQPVRIAVGEERQGLDFIVRPVLTSRITGRVVAPDGQNVTGASLRLRASGQSDLMSVALMALSSNARIAADGTFTMNNVPPGQYTLEARTYAGGMNAMALAAGAAAGFTPPKPQLFASADIVVASGQPVTGIDLRLQPGLRVSGTLTFNAGVGEPPKDGGGVIVTLMPVTTDLLSLATSGMARVAADGSFVLEGVIPGRYIINATTTDLAQLLHWMPSSVTVGGREVLDVPIDIAAGGDLRDLAITMTDAQQEVSGTLQDASGRPATEFTIVLFSTDRAHWFQNSRRVLVARPATDGSFSFKGPLGPPPGEYFLAALTDLAPENQYNPALLAEIAAASIKVRVVSGGQTRQDVRIAK